MAKRSSGPRTQSSVRLPGDISQAFKGIADQSGLSVNEQFHRVVARFVAEHHGVIPGSQDFGQVTPMPFPPPPSNLNQNGAALPADQDPLELLYEQYFFCLSCPTVISNVAGALEYANEPFERMVGKRVSRGSTPEMHWERSIISPADWIMKHHAFVCANRLPIFCLERVQLQHHVAHQDKLVMRFPVYELPEKPQKGHHSDAPAAKKLRGVAAIFFALEELRETAVLKPYRETSRLRTDVVPKYMPDPSRKAGHALKEFISSVPGITTVKNLGGVLLCVNSQYERVTGKRKEDVRGKRPAENWPPSSARMIMDHDLVVRETCAPFLSVETLELGSKKLERLNLRFPILGPTGQLELTATLGFDYNLLRNVVGKFTPRGHADEPSNSPSEEKIFDIVYSFTPDDPNSLISHDSGDKPHRAAATH